MTEDPAKARFMILNLVRVTGMTLALLGLAIVAGKVSVPREVGYVFFVVGLLDAMIVPIILARKWKTPRP
jgi:hypothetical protein